MKKTIREQAMEWWNNLSSLQKTQICDTHTEVLGSSVRRWETLTGSEIELLWKDNSEDEMYEVPKAWLMGLLHCANQLEEKSSNYEHGLSIQNDKAFISAMSLLGYCKSASGILKFNKLKK